MILCLVDDLMFASKIRAAAKTVGVDVGFERTNAGVLSRVRADRPSLVILDLNHAPLRPIEIVAMMKQDADLRRIRTLGYVSHVDSDLITAARQAGIDDVLARSAFSTQLPAILKKGQ